MKEIQYLISCVNRDNVVAINLKGSMNPIVQALSVRRKYIQSTIGKHLTLKENISI